MARGLLIARGSFARFLDSSGCLACSFWRGLMEAARGKLKPKLKLGVDLMRWLSGD